MRRANYVVKELLTEVEARIARRGDGTQVGIPLQTWTAELVPCDDEGSLPPELAWGPIRVNAISEHEIARYQPGRRFSVELVLTPIE